MRDFPCYLSPVRFNSFNSGPFLGSFPTHNVLAIYCLLSLDPSMNYKIKIDLFFGKVAILQYSLIFISFSHDSNNYGEQTLVCSLYSNASKIVNSLLKKITHVTRCTVCSS